MSPANPMSDEMLTYAQPLAQQSSVGAMKDMADWSCLPKDMYVTSARMIDPIFWEATVCQVPMAMVPEVRYIRSDLIGRPCNPEPDSILADLLQERARSAEMKEELGQYVKEVDKLANELDAARRTIASLRAALGEAREWIDRWPGRRHIDRPMLDERDALLFRLATLAQPAESGGRDEASAPKTEKCSSVRTSDVDWQAMHTAPIDGTEIQVKGEAGPYGVIYWEGVAKWHVPINTHRDNGGFASPHGALLWQAGYNPTHWRPRKPVSPTPPVNGGASEGEEQEDMDTATEIVGLLDGVRMPNSMRLDTIHMRVAAALTAARASGEKAGREAMWNKIAVAIDDIAPSNWSRGSAISAIGEAKP